MGTNDNIVDLDARNPHLVIAGSDGGLRVVPVSFFDDVISGRQSLKNLEEFEAIVPTIINEWLKHRGLD